MQPNAVIEKIISNLQGLVLVTASDPLEVNEPYTKVTIRPVALKNEIVLQFVSTARKKTITDNRSKDAASEALSNLFDRFRQFIVRFSDMEIHLFHHKDGSWKQKTKKIAVSLPISYEHNRKKRYAVQEDVVLPFLQKLGIQKQDGGIIQDQRDKFIQINRFLEIIEHSIKHMQHDKHLVIYDLGCGKAYLTFSLCHYLLSKGFTDFLICGVDQNPELIQFCIRLAHSLGWHQLRFEEGSIATLKSKGHVDIVIALHACDTATDDTLLQALLWKARLILVAPCCQQELIKKISKKTAPALLGHGLLRERFCALLTDAMRAQLLEIAGYSVDCIEFVDLQHTPKNLLIRAEKKSMPPAKEKIEDYKALKQQFLVEPKLSRLMLRENIIPSLFGDLGTIELHDDGSKIIS